MTAKQRRILEKPELTCYNCNVTSKDVRLRPNPYEVEIHGDFEVHLICDNCCYSMAEEI